MKTTLKAVCFGEILFDVFPNYKKIGGASLNVASRLQTLGAKVAIISAIGTDENGQQLMEYLDELKINTDAIEIKKEFSTGMVNVFINEKGNASYDIQYPSAWDRIAVSDTNKRIVEQADVLLYGSLSCRDAVSKNTLLELLTHAKYKIFDVNLRAPHYELETLKELTWIADFIKFNDDELYEIAQELGSKTPSLEQNIKFIAEKTNTATICVTLGAHGAVLYEGQKFYHNSGFKVDVVNTVGAGDSFLATLIYQLHNQNDPQYAVHFAAAVGAIVAQHDGANPEITSNEISDFLKGF